MRSTFPRIVSLATDPRAYHLQWRCDIQKSYIINAVISVRPADADLTSSRSSRSVRLQTMLSTASFHDNWPTGVSGKPVPEHQTILDFAAARDDGGGSGDNQNS